MTNGIELLTQPELDILDLLVKVVNQFGALPEHHPSDGDDCVNAVHVLQRQIMARAARRAYPERFRKMDPKSVDTACPWE